MSVPEDVRKVRRPVNTIVYDSKREGPKRYFVRERYECKYVKGKCPQPVSGKVIGYIYDGKFVPKIRQWLWPNPIVCLLAEPHLPIPYVLG